MSEPRSPAVRVAVNLLWMVPGEVGGSETYTISHLDALAAGAGDTVALTLFALPGFAGRHRELASTFAVTESPLGGRSRPARVALEATWLAHRCAQGFDVVHHPGGTLPLRGLDRTVLTIHDLQWVRYPEYFSRTKLAYLRARVAPSARAATVVTVNSEFVKGTVVDHAGVPPERIVVVPPALVRPPGASGTSLDDLRTRYALDRPWFLFPAITYPHKNHAVLIEAISRLAGSALLVLTGGEAGAEGAIRDHARRLGVTDHVRRLGRVPQDDLEALFRGAAGLVFPSRYEGFGMGVGEAMVRGCPVVAADATALPEVVGDAGLLVDPDDAGAWARAMGQLLDDAGLRQRLAEAGQERARRFGPERAAAALVSAYRAAAPVQ